MNVSRLDPNALLRRSLLVAVSTLIVTPSDAAAQEQEPQQECMAAFSESQRLREEGRLLATRDMLKRCAARGCLDVVRTRCTVWYQEVERDIPTVIVAIEPPGGEENVDVTIDGAPIDVGGLALPLDPGEHVFTVRADGAKTKRYTRIVEQGVKNQIITLHIEPERTPTPQGAEPVGLQPPPPSGSATVDRSRSEWTPHPLAWAGVLSTAGGLALGTVLGVVALDRAAACRAMPCSRFEIDNAGDIADASTATFVASGLTGAATMALLLTTWVLHDGATDQPQLSVSLGGLSLGWRF